MTTAQIGGVRVSMPLTVMRVGGVSATGTLQNITSKAQIGGVSAAGTVAITSSTAQIGGVSVTGTLKAATSKAQIGGVYIGSSSIISLQLIPSVKVEPFTLVTLTALINPGSQPAQSFGWRQISGPTAVLNTSAAVCVIEMPANLAGDTITVGVTAITVDGTASPEIQTSISTYPATILVHKSTGWVGIPSIRLNQAQSVSRGLGANPLGTSLLGS